MSVTQLIAIEILQLIVLACISFHPDVLKLRLVPARRKDWASRCDISRH
jgi:hypothetical protein